MMRNKAKKMGYKLNEHKIIDINNNNKSFNIKTEKDIFEFLDMKYIEPYLRK
jgi:DNA polymerase/3'-5' exonuclease PolX